MSEQKFLLAGEVLSVSDEMIVMETVERRPSGEYPDEHEIFIADADSLVSPGDRKMIMGNIDQDPDDRRRLRLVAERTNIKDHSSTLDRNIARVSGRLDRNLEYFEAVPEEGKRAFANLLLVIDERFYMRGVALQAAQAMQMHRSGKYLEGAEVEIQGRLQTRPFTSGDEERVALEIVVSRDKILKKAEDSDPFAEFEKETASAGI